MSSKESTLRYVPRRREYLHVDVCCFVTSMAACFKELRILMLTFMSSVMDYFSISDTLIRPMCLYLLAHDNIIIISYYNSFISLIWESHLLGVVCPYFGVLTSNINDEGAPKSKFYCESAGALPKLFCSCCAPLLHLPHIYHSKSFDNSCLLDDVVG